MNFNGHHINEREVIGIGPLQEEQHPDEAEALGYGSGRFFYFVQLTSGIKRVESPWFCRINAEGRAAMVRWRNEYQAAYNQLLDYRFYHSKSILHQKN